VSLRWKTLRSRLCSDFGETLSGFSSRLHGATILSGTVGVSMKLALCLPLFLTFLAGQELRATGPAVEAEVSPRDWRLGIAAWSFNRFTFFEAVDKTAALGLRHIEAFEGQILSPDSDLKIGVDLPDEAIARTKAKLDGAGVRLTSIYIHSVPGEEAQCRRIFEFCRKLGIEAIISEPEPEALDTIERFCEEYGISLAIHNHPEGDSRYWHPREVLKAIEGRSPRIGASADVGHWQRSGITPAEGVRLLGRRILSVHVKDLSERSRQGHDVPWGTGVGDIAGLLEEVHRQQINPVLFAIEYEHNWDNSVPEIEQCVRFFNQQRERIVSGSANQEQSLHVGWASVDITPEKPVALIGQLHKRIARSTLDPLTATALALETRAGNGDREQAIMISCDVLWIQKLMQERVRELIGAQIPDFDTMKLFLNATHTHTAPGFEDVTFRDIYDVSTDEGVMKASEYGDFFAERVAQAAVQAWRNRKPGGMSWGLAYAAIGTNRRATYFDGSAVMYGKTDRPDFSHIEGHDDPGVELLYFWGENDKLTGVLINIACPAQETEHLEQVSADFWHDTREELRRRYSSDLFVFPQIAAAGDISSHLLFRSRAEQAMHAAQGLSRRQVLARRISNAVDEAFEAARQGIQREIPFRHSVVFVDLPEQDASKQPFYESDPVKPAEIHVLRLGDFALATNPFEMYLDYGIRIKARSPALLTFIVQLSSQHSGYLPTARAIEGGGYSADKFVVGPEGGQVLVEETVKEIKKLWP
jgi:sugar phosphate isomerase/epimerase